MSDQLVIKDWKVYFESLGPGTPSPLASDKSSAFNGPVRCSLSFSRKGSLTSRDMPTGNQLFDWVREVWEAEGRPEMWVFMNTSGPPWHVLPSH